MKLYQLFLFVVLACRSVEVVALPLSHAAETVAAIPTHNILLIVIFISLFFLFVVFLGIKFVYMENRRLGTVRAPHGMVCSVPTTAHFGFRGKRNRGLLVGCLGSPTWETNLTSKLNRATWRREQRKSSFAYQLHTRSTPRSTYYSVSARPKSKDSSPGSRFTKSTTFTSYSSHADQLFLLSSKSSGSSRVTSRLGAGSSSRARFEMQRNASTDGHPRYGDFGEIHGVRLPASGIPNIARRASPSSIRLVDGPSLSNQVEYSFLSVLPSNAVVKSPLMGTRDSIQLSRCSLKCDRKLAPPLPSLPSFLPLYVQKGPETMEPQLLQARKYLPPLRFSPLASATKVFRSQPPVSQRKAPSGRVADVDESRNVVYSGVVCLESASSSKTCSASPTSPSFDQEISVLHPIRKTSSKSGHKGSQSCHGLAIRGLLLRTLPWQDKIRSEVGSMQTNILRAPSGSSRGSSITPKKPPKSCLRQYSVVPMPLACDPVYTFTPSTSEVSTRTYCMRRSTGDQASVRTPISDDDVGILRLDRFCWNDEIKELKVQSSHMKQDSVVLVPLRE